ncbi:MAG TPA: hypothetical protein PLZ32_09805 [Saprospiraceae bacterium]|nr:hypothetical protein [Saprospiraceae bacterium]
MLGYFLYGLTLIAYILVIITVLQPHHSGGSDAAYGAAMSILFVTVAFILTSLLLTVNITMQGGFNWISDSLLKRNITVAIVWLGIMIGVSFFLLHHTEFHRYYQLSGFARFLSYMLSYGAIWLPLLMLVPYYLFIKNEWAHSFTPNLFKIPLVMASLIGFSLVMKPKIISNYFRSFRAFDKSELDFKDAMDRMKKYPDVSSLLYYTSKSNEEAVRNAAITKIKTTKNLEAELIKVLEKGNPFTCMNAYNFLVENKVQNPELFIEPIIKSFDKLIAETHEGIVNPYKGGPLDIEVVLLVLDEQFKDSAPKFKPSILKLQEVMETPPARSRQQPGELEQAKETINKNKEQIKLWLDAHS